jgi:hypothetical protein
MRVGSLQPISYGHRIGAEVHTATPHTSLAPFRGGSAGLALLWVPRGSIIRLCVGVADDMRRLTNVSGSRRELTAGST